MVAREAAFVLQDCGARFLITEPALEDVAKGAVEEAPEVMLMVLDAEESGAELRGARPGGTDRG